MIHGLAWIPVLCMVGIIVFAIRTMVQHERRYRKPRRDTSVAREWDRILLAPREAPRPADSDIEYARRVLIDTPAPVQAGVAECDTEDSLDDREIASAGYGPY